jgi:hypothetical protein
MTFIEKEFEKWKIARGLDDNPFIHPSVTAWCEAAWRAGYAAGKERAAEICLITSVNKNGWRFSGSPAGISWLDYEGGIYDSRRSEGTCQEFKKLSGISSGTA